MPGSEGSNDKVITFTVKSRTVELHKALDERTMDSWSGGYVELGFGITTRQSRVGDKTWQPCKESESL